MPATALEDRWHDEDRATPIPTNEYYQHAHDFRAAEPEDEAAIREYIELKATIAQLEEQLKELQPRITALVLDQPDEPVARAFGFTFSVHYRKTWTYSNHVDELAEQLRATKKYEEAHGLATLSKQAAVLTLKPIR